MIPYFKALDLMFWPLAWILTLGSIIFAVWNKTFVNFLMRHPLQTDILISEKILFGGDELPSIQNSIFALTTFSILFHDEFLLIEIFYTCWKGAIHKLYFRDSWPTSYSKVMILWVMFAFFQRTKEETIMGADILLPYVFSTHTFRILSKPQSMGILLFALSIKHCKLMTIRMNDKKIELF